MAFWSLSALRTILATETDADSPISEELMSQYRENIEAIIMLLLDTGVSGVADSDPPNDTTGVLTDAAPGFTADDHNGRTLLITSGLAIGNLYTIDDTTTTTLVCTGDNLYADGVRGADTYKILYDLKNNTDGHDHNGVNSKPVVLQKGTLILPWIMLPTDTALIYNVDENWYTVPDPYAHLYIPPGVTKIYGNGRIWTDDHTCYVHWRFDVGGNNSSIGSSDSETAEWVGEDESVYLDVSAMAGSWQDFKIEIKTDDAADSRARIQGFSFYCE
jgi:hypothetical protein